MARHMTEAEVREEHLRVLGEGLGSLYNKLYQELTLLCAKWQEYRKLYAVSPERVALLNRTAPFFFVIAERVFWEDILLHVARLTDPPKAAGKANLSIMSLLTVVPDGALAARLRSRVDTAIARCKFARDWRNRRLAHRDLDLALGLSLAAPLPPVSRQVIEDALASLEGVLDCLSSHYFGSEVGYSHFVAYTGSDTLVWHLSMAVWYQEHREARLKAGSPLPEDLESPPRV